MSGALAFGSPISLYTDAVTLLCVPILVHDVNVALAEARSARIAGADLVEFRVDPLFHGEGDEEGLASITRLVDESPLACIVTCRLAAEGGEYEGEEAARVVLWEHLGTAQGTRLSPKHPPRYIDVELATYQRSANLRQKIALAVDHEAQRRDLHTSLILSAHDFNSRPLNLLRLVAEMDAAPISRVNKIAWRARSIRDNIEAFELLQHRSRPTIAVCMGEFGLLSRILAPKFGGFLTFASLRDTSTTAPGQPTIADLLGLYRFRSINPETRVFGVIGWPVAQSRSPHLHNAGFEAINFNGVYVPMPVPQEWEHFKSTLHALLDFKALDFRGASVTIPHKEHLVRFARGDSSRQWTIDPLAARCGAANTIVVNDDASCRALNTDATAASETLRESLGDDWASHRVAILGAGGVARAVAAAVVEAGGRVAVHARNRDRADRLVADLSDGGVSRGALTVGDWGALADLGASVVVNCTPIGMSGRPDSAESPLSLQELRKLGAVALIFDTVYNPPETPLLRQARDLGLKTAGGAEMFVAQAAAQFEAWTGRPAPKALFRSVLLETLATDAT
ncbi:MAG: type I 3-dehydroquinate dehydratase [Phycisphaerae bacterium]|nr:type I 3-dehydroquinate dehydratase [Phycisphaerae bacterium]